jgi:SAM-dependent methyltransferase
MKIWDLLQKILGAENSKIRIYRELVNANNGEKLLDFGCATGSTSVSFLGTDYLGIDIDEASIKLAKSKFSDKTKYFDMKFECVDLFQTSIDGFDHIVFACTAHHLSDHDLVKIVNELISKLKKGGKLHFIDNVKIDLDSFLVKFMHSIDRGRYIRKSNDYDLINKKIYGAKLDTCKIIESKDPIVNYSFIYFRYIRY